MRDPNLTLVELDYTKYVIQYRDPLIDKALKEARKQTSRITKSEWGDIQAAVTFKMSNLTSVENKLTAMRIRSGNKPELGTLIGEHVDLLTKERADMMEIIGYYKGLCRKYHWYYSWYW